MNKRKRKKLLQKNLKETEEVTYEYRQLLNKSFQKDSCAWLLSLSYMDSEELAKVFAKYGVITEEDLIETIICFSRNIEPVKEHFKSWPYAKDILLRTSITMLEDLTGDSDSIQFYLKRKRECEQKLIKAFINELKEKLTSDSDPCDIAPNFSTFMEHMKKYFEYHGFYKNAMPTYAEQMLYEIREELFTYIARWQNDERYREWAAEMKEAAIQRIKKIEEMNQMWNTL